MAILPPPSSQKADVRPISFMLVDPTTPEIISRSRTITLAIRPEELTRTDPSRITTHQTLGGAWQDNFGTGIPTITIAGHTGWHRSQEGTDTPDGLDRWKALRALIFDDWHSRKQDAIKAGRDPDQIQLIFADKLDDFACVVSTPAIVLRRSRARPLLCMYQVTMTVLDQIINPVPNATTPALITNSPSDLQAAALVSVGISLSRIQAFAANIGNSIDQSLAVPVQNFMNTTMSLYSAVTTAVSVADANAASLVSVAHFTAQVGLNLFRTVAALVALPSFARAQIMEVAAEYSNLFCVLINAFNQQLFYQDYSSLYGSSNCSSTNGGDPPSRFFDRNPFFDVIPINPALAATISPNAFQSMQAIAVNDPVLSPFSVPQLASHLTAINAGLSVQ